MNLQYSNRYIKKDGKLFNTKPSENKVYQLFVDSIPEGAFVDVYMNVEADDASLAQLAKIHAMCRVLAIHIGETFTDMKLLIKEKAGLVKQNNGELIVKSFGTCSKEELSLAIQAAKEIGELVNCPVD